MRTSIAPLDVPAAYIVVAERLRRMIALGEVLPGERLPAERSLAEGFAVSRLTVREALRTLQGEGLIETRRGNRGGAVVLGAGVSPALRRRRMREVAEELRVTHEMRLAIEPMAARLAAGRRDSGHLERLRALDEPLRASASVGEFRRADGAFHLLVADAAANPRLLAAVADARSELFYALDAQDYEVLAVASADSHASIVDAIDDRDAERAAATMTKHLERAWGEIEAVLDR